MAQIDYANKKRTAKLIDNPSKVSSALWMVRMAQLIDAPDLTNMKFVFQKYPPGTCASTKEDDCTVVCNICRDLYSGDRNADPKKWEIGYGSSHSTSHVDKHFRNQHVKEYTDVEVKRQV